MANAHYDSYRWKKNKTIYIIAKYEINKMLMIFVESDSLRQHTSMWRFCGCDYDNAFIKTLVDLSGVVEKLTFIIVFISM